MIVKLHIQNFKNYENQEIEFPDYGFILIAGPNGSGKSGIGEAIGFTLGLESLMSFLRQSGRKISNLIKEGTEESIIHLSLSNHEISGYLPFRSDSRVIEIVRKVRRDGTSYLKATGFPSPITSLQDLHQLANFSTSNPFIFIPQGKLSDLIPIDINRKSDIKYLEEFEKITGLSELKTKMLEANDKLEESKAILDTFKEDKYQPALDYLTNIEKMFEMYVDFECKKLELLASQLIYHLIQKYQNEKEYDIFLEEFTNANKIFEEIKIQLNELEEKPKNLEEEKEKLLKIFNQKSQNLKELLNKKSNIEFEKRNAQNTQIEEQAKIKNFEFRENELIEKIKGLQSQLEILSKNSDEDEKSNELIKQLNTLKNDLLILEQNKEEKLNKLFENYLQNSKKINKKLKNEQDFYERIHSLKDELKKIEKEMKNKDSRYDPIIQKILDFIETKKLEVLGPAGNFIEILNPEAWKAVEIALGYNLLHSFITFEEKDQKELDKFIIQNKIRNIKVHWFPPNTKVPKFGNFSNSDDLILGRVIDLISISKDPIKLILNEYNGKNWIVCKDEKTAHEIAKIQRTPTISIKGLIKRPTKYGSGISSEYREAHKGILSMGSRKEDLEHIQKEYDELINLNTNYNSEKKSLSESMNNEIRIISNNIEDIKQSLKNKSTAFMEIQIRIDENQKELQNIQQELKTSKNILDEISKLFQELKDEESRINDEIDTLTPLISKIDSKIQNINGELERIQLEINDLNEKITNIDIDSLQNRVSNSKTILESLNGIIEEMLDKAMNLLKNIDEQIKNATDVELRLYRKQESLLKDIINLKTNEEIKNWQIIDIHDDIIRLETILNSTTLTYDIVEKYSSAKKELDALEEQKNNLEFVLKSRESEYQKNFEDWYNQIKELIENLKNKFKEYIETIGGNGYIKISSLENPSIARMDLFATFKENTPPRSIASHTHSGGEKTMIIMAFILAIQSIKPQPFYILDEPDAHLDPENRDKLFTMIKEASKETQYIVISPQENREKHPIPDVIYYLFNNQGNTIIKRLN